MIASRSNLSFNLAKTNISINIWFYLFNENGNIIVNQKCQDIKMDKIYPSKEM